uniref:CHHC U11-48K-type domain-containing protein n=1 Tax=Arion vulgaris TaxID=1028688 RepID=A0A0B7A2J6_9EUPU
MMINEMRDAPTECPYDNTHIVSNRSLGTHLIKCRQNHKLHKKVACKFDKTHLVPKPELSHHLSVCRSRYLLDRELQLKASAGVTGILSGNVQAPKIVNYYLDDDEEEWGSVPNTGAPVALFNQKEKDYFEEDENYRPIGLSSSYLQDNTRSVSSEEKTCRKLPHELSRAAKIEMSMSNAKPSTGNQVHLFSVQQSINAGWGRGRGVGRQQAVPGVGVVKPLQCHPEPHHVLQSSGLAVERYSADNFSLPENNGQHFLQELGHQPFLSNTLTPDQYEDVVEPHSQQRKLQSKLANKMLHLEQGYQSAVQHTQDCPLEIQSLKTNLSSKNPMYISSFNNTVSQVYENQSTAQIVPKGRGHPRGIETLMAPRSSSYAQAISLQSNSKHIEPSIRDKKTDNAEDDNSKTEQVSTDMDYSLLNSDNLWKTKRKLEKKLKQIKVLEQKLSDGRKLTNEEEMKLQTKNELMSLTEKISKLL